MTPALLIVIVIGVGGAIGLLISAIHERMIHRPYTYEYVPLEALLTEEQRMPSSTANSAWVRDKFREVYGEAEADAVDRMVEKMVVQELKRNG